MNLDVHVWKTRRGRYRARCTGRHGSADLTVCSAGWDRPEDAASSAVSRWLGVVSVRRLVGAVA